MPSGAANERIPVCEPGLFAAKPEMEDIPPQKFAAQAAEIAAYAGSPLCFTRIVSASAVDFAASDRRFASFLRRPLVGSSGHAANCAGFAAPLRLPSFKRPLAGES